MIISMGSPFQEALVWYASAADSTSDPRGPICLTRDVFQARLDTFYQEITARHLLSDNDTALLAAVLGELGNNCFDHNLGQWKEAVGCWFEWQHEKREDLLFAVVADRGQGIWNSLKRVRPDLRGEDEALKMAFELKISGRSPERRGNGLKFVRSVINGSQKRGLVFYSGKAKIRLGGLSDLEKRFGEDLILSAKTTGGTGTVALVAWSNP